MTYRYHFTTRPLIGPFQLVTSYKLPGLMVVCLQMARDEWVNQSWCNFCRKKKNKKSNIMCVGVKGAASTLWPAL